MSPRKSTYISCVVNAVDSLGVLKCSVDRCNDQNSTCGRWQVQLRLTCCTCTWSRHCNVINKISTFCWRRFAVLIEIAIATSRSRLPQSRRLRLGKLLAPATGQSTVAVVAPPVEISFQHASHIMRQLHHPVAVTAARRRHYCSTSSYIAHCLVLFIAHLYKCKRFLFLLLAWLTRVHAVLTIVLSGFIQYFND